MVASLIVQKATLPTDASIISLISNLLSPYDLQIAAGGIALLFLLGSCHLLLGFKRALAILPDLTIFSCSTYIFYQFLTLFDILSETPHLLISIAYGVIMSLIFHRLSKDDPKFAYGFAPLLAVGFISDWIYQGIDYIGNLFGNPEVDEFDVDLNEHGLLKGMASIFLAIFVLALFRVDHRRMIYTACFGTYLLTVSSAMFVSLRNCGGVFSLVGAVEVEPVVDSAFSSECRPPWLLGLERMITRVPTERQLVDLHRVVFPWNCAGCLALPTLLVVIGFAFQIATRGVPVLDSLRLGSPKSSKSLSSSGSRGRRHAGSNGTSSSSRRSSAKISEYDEQEQDQRQFESEPDADVEPMQKWYATPKSIAEYAIEGKRHTIEALRGLLPFLDDERQKKQAQKDIARLEKQLLENETSSQSQSPSSKSQSNGSTTTATTNGAGGASPKRRVSVRRSVRLRPSHIGMFTCKDAMVMLIVCIVLTLLVFVFYQSQRPAHILSLASSSEPLVKGWEYQEFVQPWRGTDTQLQALHTYLVRTPLVNFIQSTLNSARDVRCILGGSTRFDGSAVITSPQVASVEGQLKVKAGTLNTIIRTLSFTHALNVTHTPNIYSEEQSSYSRCPSSMEFNPAATSGSTWIDLPFCDQPVAAVVVKEKWKKFVPAKLASSQDDLRRSKKRFAPTWTVEEVEVKAHLECAWRAIEGWKSVMQEEEASAWGSSEIERGGEGSGSERRLSIEVKRPFRIGDYMYELPPVVPEVQLHSRTQA